MVLFCCIELNEKIAIKEFYSQQLLEPSVFLHFVTASKLIFKQFKKF